MGTRGLWGFYKDGGYKATYNHCDSYPEWLGENVVDFIKDTSVEEMKKIYNKIILVERDFPANQQQIDECKKFADKNIVVDSALDNWYVLLRETQGLPSLYRDTDLRYMIGSLAFMSDPLMCEFVYLINLDEKVLEVYIPFSDAGVFKVMTIKFETIKKQSVFEVVKRMADYLRMRYGLPI